MGVWRALRGTVCCLIAVYLLAPLAIIVVISFSAAPFLHFPPPGFSLRWYDNLFGDPSWISAIAISLQVLVPASILATLLGTASAYALIRGHIPGATIIFASLMLPIVVPAIITAASLYGVYSGLGLNGTITGLIIGHTVLITPYVVATVGAALRTLDTRLEDAAATLGAHPWPAFRRVTLPLILPSVLSGLLFAMVVSFDELLVSLFVSTTRTRTVPVLMWSNVRGDFDPTIAAIATLSFAFALIALLLEMALRRTVTQPMAR